MDRDQIIQKIKTITEFLQRTEYFYGSKTYGTSTYCLADVELNVTRERSLAKDQCTYVIITSEFIAEYIKGIKDFNEGKSQYTNFKKFNDLQFVGDPESLDKTLFLLALCKSD